MAANGGTALRNLDKFRNRTKRINTVTPQPNYNIANLPKSQNEMVHFLEKLSQEMAVQKDTDSRVQALRKLCDLVYLLVQLHQQKQSWRQRSPYNNEDKLEEGVEEDAKDNLDGEQLWSAFLNNAKILRSVLNFAVTDDKLAVVAKEACETMVTLATLIKDELAEPLAEHLVGSLWKASNSNVSGVSDVAVKALKTFIQYVQHRRLVKAVLSLFTIQSMTLPMSRNLASEFVGNILIYQKPSDFQPYLEELEKIIAVGLKDSSSTIKATYRKNFWLLAKAMPEQVQEWANRMDTIDWKSVQEARPAEAPALTFIHARNSSEQPHKLANATVGKKTVARKTTPLKTVNEHDANNGRKGKMERSQPLNATASRTSLRNTTSSGTDTKDVKSRIGEKSTVNKSNAGSMKASRSTLHTVSSSAKRILNDKRKDSNNASQKLSARRNQEKQKEQEGENSETMETGDSNQPEMKEKEHVLDTEEVIVEAQEEEKIENPVVLLTEQEITEKALIEVLDRLDTLTEVNTNMKIIHSIENHIDNAMKEIEKQRVSSTTSIENDSHWIKKEERCEEQASILHFVPLVLEIITKYLLDGNEKLVVPSMKAFIKLLETFAHQELRQHSRTLQSAYHDMEETLRRNSVLLQKIFEKSGDSNGFIASTATTVLEEMERAVPFFPSLLEFISQSCLRQNANQELSVKVILQALVYIKAAIQKNRKQQNSYFGETAAENADAVSTIELLVKDVGPHAGGKSAELRRAACDVLMELEEVPTAILEQVVLERDESKHLHLLQRLGLIASSVTAAEEKPNKEIPGSLEKQGNESQVQNTEARFPQHKESCELNSETSELPQKSNEEISKTENTKHATSVTTKLSKNVTAGVPLEDTFQSEFEALREKWMKNKEQNENEAKEPEIVENESMVQEHTKVIFVSENRETHQVPDADVKKEVSNVHPVGESQSLMREELVEETQMQNSQAENAISTNCIEETVKSCNKPTKVDPVSLPSLRSGQSFIKNIAHKLCTVNKEDEKECSATLTEIREQLQLEENTFGVSEIYDLLFMFLLFSRNNSSADTNHLLDMEFLWQMNFRELWKRSTPMDCLEALDLFCWELDDTCSSLSRVDAYLQVPSKTFEMKMLFQGMEHALKVLDKPSESLGTTQHEQIERLKPAILSALHPETCLEIKQAAHKCVEETKDRLRDKQETIPFLEWCRDLNWSVA